MRGGDNRTGELFSYVDLEARVRRAACRRGLPAGGTRGQLLRGSKWHSRHYEKRKIGRASVSRNLRRARA
ncbi:hypothetical protein D3227_39955 [Mesorhizobium waimense]|uniref:Uncharacterized protein n=1 Tax=Mesorhizobium waimense TaxID=1300307 RepID=A0A3A5JMU8_9HYPH|nr:hypothetical protein D3227_39955 [Mesorhizobium waimense]